MCVNYNVSQEMFQKRNLHWYLQPKYMCNGYIAEAERHIPVKADTAYTSVLEDPGPLGGNQKCVHSAVLSKN